MSSWDSEGVITPNVRPTPQELVSENHAMSIQLLNSPQGGWPTVAEGSDAHDARRNNSSSDHEIAADFILGWH
jgi:hypothetical protein